jgi:predicted alpha/beta-fold hydrolase
MAQIIKSSFQPAWWLKHSHLQTLYPALARKNPLTGKINRERWDTPDSDFLDVDFYGHNQDQTQGIVILLHGLTGSSQSGYIAGLQQVFAERGIATVAPNFRGCSGQPNNRARSYHSGETEDLDWVYQVVSKRFPDQPLAIVGFSLGGNVLLKWLGEKKHQADIQAACAVSVPYRLDLCATRLDQGFSKLYRYSLIKELKEYIRNKQTHLIQNNWLEEADKINALGDLNRIRSFWEYDDRVVARLHGFKSAHDYYSRSSSIRYLKSIEVPTLLIHALDDPFMTRNVIPDKHQLAEQTTLELSASGGHVGFVSGRLPGQPEYWLEKRIPEFIVLRGKSRRSGRDG